METKLSIKLKALRKNYNYNATQVINKLKDNNLHYSTQSLYKWEQGNAIPEIKTIQALAKIYHCNISYLIDETGCEYKNLTANELFLLNLFRDDFLFRSICIQIINRFDRDNA